MKPFCGRSVFARRCRHSFKVEMQKHPIRGNVWVRFGIITLLVIAGSMIWRLVA